MSSRWLVAAGACLIATAAIAAARVPPRSAAPAEPPAGRDIYLRGVLGSGKPLEGTRADGLVTAGAVAACVNCHQRSGLGSVEGTLAMPPVTGDYLFHPPEQVPGEEPLPYAEGRRGTRAAYTDESLAKAIRDGVDPQGRQFNYLMPRYALGDADMAALIEHLKTLTVRRVPGVTETVLHFATIVTPDADPQKRRGMLEVLEQFFIRKNNFPLKPSPPLLTSGRTHYAKSMYMANRHWELHVWELTGPPSRWRAQLEKLQAEHPVYAVISGLAGSDWAPIHEFCERDAVPCLFPNVEVPVVAESDFYPMYFSKGVLLEAELIARDILGKDVRPAAVEQVYRTGDSGEAAAAWLRAQLKASGVEVHETVLPASRKVTAALTGAATRDRPMVLWLRPADLAALAGVPTRSGAVYLSGLMGGLERSPVPAGWREHAHMAYPFDLPQKRGVRLDYPLGWFAYKRIPIVAEQVQTDTFLACSLLADVLNRMADNFSRPYLIEQLQMLLDHRLITGYYPRLTLAANQRFASKGGYLVHFRDAAGTALVAESDWIVP